jgi:methanogenic corrinoid protein MtbC1
VTIRPGAPGTAICHTAAEEAPLHAEEAEWRDGLEQAFLAVDRAAAAHVVGEAAAALGPARTVEAVLVPALERLGDRWAAGRASLSQVYMAGRHADELCTALLPPAAPAVGARRVGVAVLEDQHLLGKRMVMAHLRAAGLAPVDLGHGLSPAALAARTREAGVEVLLVSALMLRAALAVKELVGLLRAGGPPVRVVVGGAPFRMDPELWRVVGADAFGATAADAPRLALAGGEGA